MEKNIFNSLDQNNEMVKLYKPTYFDRGGDHLVYELEGHPNVVLKASTFKIVDILCATPSNELGNLPEELKQQLMEVMRVKNLQERELRKYFPAGTILPEKRYLIKVPITKEIIDELFSTDWKNRLPPPGYESLTEVWTIAIVQKKSDEVKSDGVTSFHFGSLLEEIGVEESVINNLNVCLLTSQEMDKKVTEEFLDVVNKKGKSNLRMVYSLLQTDEKFRIIFEDLIRRIVKFTNETGNIVAIAGRNNLVLFKGIDNAEWNYHLVDVLPIYSEDMFSCSKQLILRLVAGEAISELEKTILIKTINFVRVINFFVKTLGLDEILDILPQDFDATTLTSLINKK
jgi:hypothetical protein